MSLREKLIKLSDELWTEGNAAAERRSRVEAANLKKAANRIREALEMDPLSDTDE